MSGIDQYTWYVLSSYLQSVNNTLTVTQDGQDASVSDSLRGVYLAPATSQIPFSQQWQLSPINSSSASASAYVIRNRQTGAGVFLTTAWTTRQCGGGSCATVPVLATYLNTQSLWEFGSWGFSDPTGGAFVYNVGNGSDWHLDVIDGQETIPSLTNRDDTGRRGQHWNLTAYAKFAASDSSSFQPVPTAASTLLAQAGSSSSSTPVITPYIVTSASSSGTQANSATGSSSSTSNPSGGQSGLSTGASAGIGVGVTAIVFIAAAIVAYLVFRRRRNRKNMASNVGQGISKEPKRREPKMPELPSGIKTPLSAKVELMGNDAAELDHFSGSERAELGHGPARHELPS